MEHPEGSPLPLLLTPRETLPVLAFLAEHPTHSPAAACKALKMSPHTWYAVTHHLEDLGLLALTKGPAGRKVKTFHVTPEGTKVLAKLTDLVAVVATSPAGLAWELAHNPPLAASPEAGELLCRLIEHAEQRGKTKELTRLARLAKKQDRPGEALLARQIAAFLRGNSAKALVISRQAVKELKREGNSRSLRKAMTVQSSCLEYTGNPEKAIVVEIDVRRLAKRAGDPAAEAEAWLGIGTLKGRLDQGADSIRHFEKALEIATEAGLATKRAKILSNLAFAKALARDPDALATADEALRAGRSAGATITVARAQLVRALLFAAAGQGKPARKAIWEAERLFAESGHEMGPDLVRQWAKLVKRTLRRRLSRSPVDWRAEALLLARTRPK